MFLVNSRPARFSAAPLGSTREGLHLLRASHLPKLRDHFAEFLNEGSLAHLWILSSSTCVGLRYGYLMDSLEVFPGSVGSITLWSKLLVITPQRFNKGPDLPKPSAYMLKPPSIRWLIYPPALPHLQSRAGTGILTRFPSTTPFGLILGAD